MNDYYTKKRLIYLYKSYKDRVNKYANTNNEYIKREVLQLDTFEMLLDKFNNYRIKLFSFFDSIENPYLTIYTQRYEYNTYNSVYDKYELEYTGVNDFTHELAKDYSLYKLGYES